MVVIRPWEDGDQEGVGSVLSAIWGEAPDLMDLFAVHGTSNAPGHPFRRTFVAMEHDGVIGVGTLWKQWLHPDRLRIAIQIDPAFHHRGIGTRLLHQLAATIPANEPQSLQTATTATDISGRAFLARHGFRQIMRTRLGTLDPRRISAPMMESLAQAEQQVAAEGYRIANLFERGAWTGSHQAIARLHAEIYRQDHVWNPVAPLSDEMAQRLFLGDDVIPDALFVVSHGTTAVGVGSVRTGSDSPSCELGWIGVTGGHRAHTQEITSALLARCLRFAHERGVSLKTEVDEANEALWQLVTGFPLDDASDWLTYAR